MLILHKFANPDAQVVGILGYILAGAVIMGCIVTFYAIMINRKKNRLMEEYGNKQQKNKTLIYTAVVLDILIIILIICYLILM